MRPATVKLGGLAPHVTDSTHHVSGPDAPAAARATVVVTAAVVTSAVAASAGRPWSTSRPGGAAVPAVPTTLTRRSSPWGPVARVARSRGPRLGGPHRDPSTGEVLPIHLFDGPRHALGGLEGDEPEAAAALRLPVEDDPGELHRSEALEGLLEVVVTSRPWEASHKNSMFCAVHRGGRLSALPRQ